MTSSLEALQGWLKLRYQEIGLDFGSNAGSAVWTQLGDDRAELGDAQLGMLTRFIVLLDSEGVQDAFQREVKSALEATSFLDHRTGVRSDQSDPLGAWQVQIVWIVTALSKSEWLRCMRELRAKSGHAEEIGLELVDISSQTIDEALHLDGVPSLMFKTRELMRRRDVDMPAWISPDAEVETRLRASMNSISDKDQREFSRGVLESAFSGGASERDDGSQPKPATGPVHVHNVRNIADADLLIATDDYASVIHGPNGTGKSSLFEAISIALLGTSKRHSEYLEDKDVLPSARSNYADHVLKRFGAADKDGPSITVGGANVLANLESDPERVRSKLVAGRGTVLAQESAREFVTMTSAELASYVLGDYSALARRVQAQVDEGAQAAKNEWQDWLRSYGLNASISKAATILRRLVAKVVNDECPPEAQGPLVWLKNLGEALPEFLEVTASARSKWEELDSVASRESVVEQAAAALERSGSAERPLVSWLIERAAVSREIVALLTNGGTVISDIRQDWVGIKDAMTQFGNWLASTSGMEDKLLAVATTESHVRLEEIRPRLEELAPVGRRLRLRKDHLSSISDSFLSEWCQDEPHECPTCASHHESDIAAVIKRVLASTMLEYDAVRAEYSRLQQEEKDIRAAMPVADVPCPVSAEQKEKFASLLNLPISGPDSLESLVQSSDARSIVFAKFERLFAVPSWKSPASEEAIGAMSAEMAAKILELRAQGSEKQELPIRWDHLKRDVDTIALEVVSNHLPKTIGGLWRELSLILAPAYWIQACKPQMTMELKRGAERLGVTVRRSLGQTDLPARHILNQAEQHVLGLAWFFTRFLTHGRFLIPFIALDDPAQEMDQVTFRKFGRFVQAFQRAHRFLSASFGIVVLLHQEDRAIDFARSITANATLTVLEWSETVQGIGPNSTVRRLQLRNPEQRPRPYSVGMGRREIVPAE